MGIKYQTSFYEKNQLNIQRVTKQNQSSVSPLSTFIIIFINLTQIQIKNEMDKH